MARVVAVALVLAFSCAMIATAVTQNHPMKGPVLDRVLGQSELFAGFLVALQEQKELWKAKGIDLTPAELVKRHREIGCQKDEAGMIVVTFFPEKLQIGGSVTYYVDPNVLKVVKTTHGR